MKETGVLLEQWSFVRLSSGQNNGVLEQRAGPDVHVAGAGKTALSCWRASVAGMLQFRSYTMNVLPQTPEIIKIVFQH